MAVPLSLYFTDPENPDRGDLPVKGTTPLKTGSVQCFGNNNSDSNSNNHNKNNNVS